MSDDLLQLAKAVEREALELGADEVCATVSRGVHTNITRRDGRVEQATESVTRGLSVTLLVDDKSSAHSTSDLRPPALKDFLIRAIDATKYLEQDPERRLPDPAWCGRGASEQELDQNDPAWETRTADERSRDAERLEAALAAQEVHGAISRAVHVSDGSSATARVTSNGFSDVTRDAWFLYGAEMTIQDAGGRRPEAAAYFGTRYLSTLPSVEEVAREVVERVNERRGSGPVASGSYPMILANRSAGRLLGALGGPLSAGSLHQGRSFLQGKLGSRIGSSLFTLLDDPLIPRGLASRPYDGEGLKAVPRAIFRDGVLENYYVGVYYGRKLDIAPTTGGHSNWVIPPGDEDPLAIARHYPKAIYVDGFLGGNSNPVTGDFSFGIRGLLLEHGERTASLSEMNVSGNLQTIFGRLVAVGNDPYKWSSAIVPTMVFEDVQFSGT